jgi:hypothetical protein
MKMDTIRTALEQPKKSNLLGKHFVRPTPVRLLRSALMNKPLRFSKNTKSPTQHTMLTPSMAKLREQYFHEHTANKSLECKRGR